MNLHGLPGLMGGIAAIFVVKDINAAAHLKSILVTIAVSLVTGYVVGVVLSLFGRRAEAYVDSEEFTE